MHFVYHENEVKDMTKANKRINKKNHYLNSAESKSNCIFLHFYRSNVVLSEQSGTSKFSAVDLNFI